VRFSGRVFARARDVQETVGAKRDREDLVTTVAGPVKRFVQSRWPVVASYAAVRKSRPLVELVADPPT
jgi:hypothetical protein